MLLVGFLLVSSVGSMVGQMAEGGLSVFSSMEFVLLVLVECVLFAAWVVCCELAENRQDNEAEQVRTRNLLRELAGADEDEVQAPYAKPSAEQLGARQAERAEREEKQAARNTVNGPKIWIAVVVLAMVLVMVVALQG